MKGDQTAITTVFRTFITKKQVDRFVKAKCVQ